MERKKRDTSVYYYLNKREQQANVPNLATTCWADLFFQRSTADHANIATVMLQSKTEQLWLCFKVGRQKDR